MQLFNFIEYILFQEEHVNKAGENDDSSNLIDDKEKSADDKREDTLRQGGTPNINSQQDGKDKNEEKKSDNEGTGKKEYDNSNFNLLFLNFIIMQSVKCHKIN